MMQVAKSLLVRCTIFVCAAGAFLGMQAYAGAASHNSSAGFNLRSLYLSAL